MANLTANILTAHCTTGMGHRSVAQAVHEVFLNAPYARDSSLIISDSLNFGSPLFKKTYAGGYEITAKYARRLCRLVYGITDKPRMSSTLVRLVCDSSAMNVTGMGAFAAENRIQAVLCTHFLPMTLFCNLRRKGIFKGRIYACVTDYDPHGFWADPDTDLYFMPDGQGGERLVKWGIPSSRVVTTGIPVRAIFRDLNPPVKQPGERLHILFMASSLTRQTAFSIMESLESTGMPLKITAVAGRNLSLYDSLQGRYAPPHIEYEARGFVTDIHTLMQKADCMITKPGGLTSTEALCAALPSLFVDPIPVHEEINAARISAKGAGLICFKGDALKTAVINLCADKKQITEMSENCLRMALPKAAETVAQYVAADLQGLRQNS